MTILAGENYNVTYSEDINCVTFKGTLRLRGLDEYQDISTMLENCLLANNTASIDLKHLDFLNSSGIAMLSRIIIKARKTDNITLTIIGSNSVPWQGKSLKNLQRLMPNLVLIFD